MNEKVISLKFALGDTVYIYDPISFGNYTIEEVRIMRVEIINIGIFYYTALSYVFTDSDIDIRVFKTFDQAVDAMKKRGVISK